jgi:hypothetical protein
MILEYEIPKYDGDLGAPNVFAHLDAATCERKIRYIVRSYKTQRVKPWFTEETLRALMRLRGVESRAPRYAEAFYGRKFQAPGAPGAVGAPDVRTPRSAPFRLRALPQ